MPKSTWILVTLSVMACGVVLFLVTGSVAFDDAEADLGWTAAAWWSLAGGVIAAAGFGGLLKVLSDRLISRNADGISPVAQGTSRI